MDLFVYSFILSLNCIATMTSQSTIYGPVPYGHFNQNLAHVAPAKYYLYRAFSEDLKQLSLILTNIWRFETTYVIQF